MSAESEIEVLANYIMSEIPGEPSQDGGAGTTAVRVLLEYIKIIAALEKELAEVKDDRKECHAALKDLQSDFEPFRAATERQMDRADALEKELAEARVEIKRLKKIGREGMIDWNEQVERAQVVFQECDTTDGRRIAILAMLDALKDPEPRIVTNVCDECGQTVHRDPTPEEIEKYKEPDQRVRHPDGSEWYCHNDGSCPYQKKGGWKGSDTRPMTFAEAFRVGATISSKDSAGRIEADIMEVRTTIIRVIIPFSCRVLSIPIDKLTLVKPAPEYE